jgi:glycosyltransferase involved in cell wall biosynthesis
MKVLVLSFYFEPDLSAGSFRSAALVAALREQLPGNACIDVLTTLPNRYSSYAVDVPVTEARDGLTVRRIALPAHNSGVVDQSRAFLAYAREVLRLVRNEDYALVYATSSRLMTAVLGSCIARRKGVPLYLDIRDIFVDTMADVLPGKLAGLLKPVLSQLERFALIRATRVNLVSRGFAAYFSERYPTLTYSFFTNGIDEEFISAYAADQADNCREATSGLSGGEIPVALYAGNIGAGQGLHNVIPELAQRMQGRVRFRLIGDGGCRGKLESSLAARSVSNVVIVPPIHRQALIEEYRAADILFLHLNDYEAFEKVLPSKVFEYAATGKPIWAGVAGYAAAFVHEHIENAAIFPPCDIAGAADAFSRLSRSSTPRSAFIRRFARRSISTAMAADIRGLLPPEWDRGRDVEAVGAGPRRKEHRGP